MAYTTIDDPTIYFNSKLYTGTGSSNSITGIGFAPNWVWIRNRASSHHMLFDTVRGATKSLYSNLTDAETTVSGHVTAFGTDGFTLGDNSGKGSSNGNSESYVVWNWSAGGSAPAITYSVKVVSDSGNKYRFDDFGTSAVTLDLQEGGTYTFDQSDSSNSGHPLRFSTTSNGTHGGGSEYTTGVTTTGTPGSAGAKTVITVGSGVATLYYYCTQHSAMGGQANTNSTFGSSNFSGSIQSTVSANTTAGFSIVSYTGTASAGATVGHGLGVKPDMIITKARAISDNWGVYHKSLGATKGLYLNTTNAEITSSAYYNNTEPTSTLVTLGDNEATNDNDTMIMYAFAEKQGYSKFGSYTGNGNADGTFVYTGFKPAFVICKNSSSAENWQILDNKRLGYNGGNQNLGANLTYAEPTSNNNLDLLSNGFKLRDTNAEVNESGSTIIYMCFASNPFVTSTGVPTNAR
nr:hypothetical protein [uncultured Mediterranean phage uvMED]